MSDTAEYRPESMFWVYMVQPFLQLSLSLFCCIERNVHQANEGRVF